jgi:hypothetical protein
MPQYFKEHGERLVELGYRIVPLPPGEKGPNRKGWPRFELTAQSVRKMAANGSAHDGIGILAATTPAIDVDILDEEVAQQMSDEIDRIFAGQSLMTRTGRAPKFLIPFRSDEPFRKLTSKVYRDGKNDHHVEILGDGQQWVAYHIHPETGKPYRWFDGIGDDGLRTVSRESLPSLSRGDARRVIDAFEVLAQRKVQSGTWTLVSGRKTEPSDGTPPADDPFGDQPVGKTESEVARLLARHPNNEADYDHWFAVLAAVNHELGDAGRELAHEWSAASAKHVDEVFAKKWESLGRYSGRMITLRSLLKEDKPEHKPRAAESDNPFQIREWADYKQDYLSTPWIIKGVLPQAEVGILYGQSGSGKTFFVLDLAATVARGAEWRSRKVSECRVVYVAAEAREGIKKRMDAYDQHVTPAGRRPDIIASAPNLLSSDAGKLAEAIGTAGLIILDTMAASHSGDENSAKDMGLFLAACKDLSLATGAMVLAVHHTGKEESKGMRGSSALFAGADFVMEVFKNEKEHGAILSKSRDDSSGVTFGFALDRVVVGHDRDGDEVTTCVVRTLDSEVTKKAKRPKKLANLEDSRYDMHREMLTIFERLTDESPSRTVSRDAVIEAVQRKFPSKLKRNLAVVLLKLVEMGVVTQNVDEYGLADDELESC